MAEIGIWWLLLGRRVWAAWGAFWSASGTLAASGWGGAAAVTQVAFLVAACLGQAWEFAGAV